MKSWSSAHGAGFHKVTTCVVVWIEIAFIPTMIGSLIVTTCVVVWIEIQSKSGF